VVWLSRFYHKERLSDNASDIYLHVLLMQQYATVKMNDALFLLGVAELWRIKVLAGAEVVE
jgi:hypothetical protein